MDQLFGSFYYDEAGHEYMYNSVSTYNSRPEESDRFTVKFTLTGYRQDTVYLSPSYSRRVTLPEEVVVNIK